jgi:hypothetical protein
VAVEIRLPQFWCWCKLFDETNSPGREVSLDALVDVDARSSEDENAEDDESDWEEGPPAGEAHDDANDNCNDCSERKQCHDETENHEDGSHDEDDSHASLSLVTGEKRALAVTVGAVDVHDVLRSLGGLVFPALMFLVYVVTAGNASCFSKFFTGW